MDNGSFIAVVPKMLNFIASGQAEDLKAVYYPHQLEQFGGGWKRVAAHLLELGFVQFVRGGYVITDAGLRVVQGWHKTPEHQQRELESEIRRLEIALGAARLKLAAFQPKDEHSNPTDAQIMRLIGDDFQNGE